MFLMFFLFFLFSSSAVSFEDIVTNLLQMRKFHIYKIINSCSNIAIIIFCDFFFFFFRFKGLTIDSEKVIPLDEKEFEERLLGKTI